MLKIHFSAKDCFWFWRQFYDVEMNLTLTFGAAKCFEKAAAAAPASTFIEEKRQIQESVTDKEGRDDSVQNVFFTL